MIEKVDQDEVGEGDFTVAHACKYLFQYFFYLVFTIITLL